MDDIAGIRLGAFRLEAPIARGGMGAVYRAVHVDHGVQVALKVLTCDPFTRDEFVARFRDEIRAVAALEHPNIAMVLDHGEVDEDAYASSRRRLPEGSPWFAMEYAPGGTLSKWPRTSFGQLKRAWVAILDALAHAHARGVIHRDLKFANILLAGPPEDLPALKLVDFGVAFARFDPDRTGPVDEQIVGTPQFMAPEQVHGAWRDYGAWTDLYALGCLAWAQLTGATPFFSKSAADTIVGHVSRPLPRFDPKLPVPPEVEGWLRGLLEKDPARRFQRASDAAHALAAIGEAVPTGRSAVIPDWSDTEVWRRNPQTPTPLAPVEATSIRIRPRTAPMPATWRRDDPPPPPAPLFGAGLRLFGVRRVPLVGRESERDQLWERLGEVTRTGRAQVVVVRGPAGTGKSALVQWLCERAMETGAASWCKATFSPALTQGEPLRRMGVQYLVTKGLARPEVRERVARFLHDHGSDDTSEIEVLTELLEPAGDAALGHKTVRLTRFREFYAGTRNTMARLASERPLVAWFDDVQWGIHGIGLATQILRTQDEQPFPSLVVLTVREEALAQGSLEEDRLGRLLALPNVTELDLAPLPRESQAELVSRLLWLAPEVATRVVERTAGNPLFAVQLVSAMVRRGELLLGERGLQLRPGAAAELPADVAGVWRVHLQRLLSEFPDQAESHLELAAVLGTPVDRKEWRRACDDPEETFGDRFAGDEPLRNALVERLIDERLAMRTPQGWAFVHGMLEEALIASAARAGRLQQHHRAAATVLSRKASEPAVAERLGLHLLAAGSPIEAAEPLLRGIEVTWVSTGPASALALLGRAHEAIAALPAEDSRRGRFLELAAALHLAEGDEALAREEAGEAVRSARKYGWTVWRAREVRAAIALREGAIPVAETEWRAMAASTDPRGQARGELGLGQIARRRGDDTEALAQFAKAAAAFVAGGEPVEAARSTVASARILYAAGDIAGAARAFEEAEAVFAAQGAAAGIAECQDGRARIAWALGDRTVAEDRLRSALSLFEALGATDRAQVARLRLARWLACERRLTDIPALIDRVSRLGGVDLAARDVLHAAARWATAALRGDLRAWDSAFEATVAGIGHLASPRTALAAETVAWLGWLAAELLPAQEPARRERALLGVNTVFQALGRADLRDELAAALAAKE